MAGILETGINVGRNLASAQSERNDKVRAARMSRDYIENLDYQPEYASDHAPTYKQAKSPVARAYLESVLMGSNPATTFSGAPNAAATKAYQQQSQNSMFGTPSERKAIGDNERDATPWAVTAPTRQVGKEDSGSGTRYASEYKQFEKNGITQPEFEDLNKRLEGNGMRFDNIDGKISFGTNGSKSVDKAFHVMSDEQAQQLNALYESGADNTAIADYLGQLASTQEKENFDKNARLGPKLRKKMKGWFTRG